MDYAEVDVWKELEINTEDIDGELKKQAPVYAYVASQSVTAEEAYNKARDEVKRVYAMLDSRLRADGVKRTEKAIEAEILSDPEYQAALNHQNDMRTEKGRWQVLRESWQMKKDLLIQAAIMARAEMEAFSCENVKNC